MKVNERRVCPLGAYPLGIPFGNAKKSHQSAKSDKTAASLDRGHARPIEMAVNQRQVLLDARAVVWLFGSETMRSTRRG